jgi:hypothetical protein
MQAMASLAVCDLRAQTGASCPHTLGNDVDVAERALAPGYGSS